MQRKRRRKINGKLNYGNQNKKKKKEKKEK